MKRHKYFKTLIGCILLLVFFVAFILRHHQSTRYPDTPISQLDQQFKSIKDYKSTVIIFHKTGCSDCEKVQKSVVETVRQDKRTHYIVLDTRNQQTKKYVKQYNVTEVPTFISLRYGKVGKSYSGTIIKNIDKVFQNMP